MITKAPPNPEHIALLSDALSHLLRDGLPGSPRGGFMNEALSDGSARTGTAFDLDLAHASMPLRCFQADLNDIDEGFRLGDMDATGWKYLVRFHHVLAIAEIREIDGEACFGRLIQGELPVLLRKAARKASDMLDGARETFEPRVLEVPALYVFALWLHGERHDYLFSETATDVGLTVEDAGLFLAHLRKAKQGRPQADPRA